MRSGETRSDISRPAPMRQIALPQGFSVSRSLAKVPVFADWRDIANLAYPLPGTEGSNPSLSAKPRLWRFSARAAEIARTGRLHSHIQQPRRKAPSGDLRAGCGRFLG